MIDKTFEQAFYWYLLNPVPVLFSVGVASSLVVLVSILLVLRKWGGFE